MAARKRSTGNYSQRCVTLKPLTTFITLIFSIVLMLSLTGCTEYFTGILNPKGLITYHERKLLFDTLALMLIVVLPVIIMSFTFVYHYRVSHHIRDYKPNWSHSYFLESLWWGIPCAIITILAIITWKETHELDPYRPIPGGMTPIKVEVIALPWKWLFIYPEQQIATINFLQIPLNQQVEFILTTDNVPMSAFFIPQLGSQIFVMAGMGTRLHLIANEIGSYDGLNTQYNGNGFSDMHFTVNVVNPEEMQSWYDSIRLSAPPLDQTTYQKLLMPSMANLPSYYSSVSPQFFDDVISVYLHTFGSKHPRGVQPT